MERKYYIYRYTNILNGMKYDGKTCCSQTHRAGKDGKGYQHCSVFWADIEKYGWPNFKYEVVEDGLTKEEAEVREQYWIEHDNCVWPNGYNLQKGGKHNPAHQQTKERISQGNKGKIKTEEWRKRIGLSRKDRKPVKQFSKDGKFIAEYSSIHEAARQTGCFHQAILKCCNRKMSQHHGFLWSYS